MYRFNAKRWSPTGGSYDMGFRRYDPGLNRFLNRDLYAGALANLNLTTSAWTNNRYAFASGNPITNVELDGHRPVGCTGACMEEYAQQHAQDALDGDYATGSGGGSGSGGGGGGSRELDCSGYGYHVATACRIADGSSASGGAYSSKGAHRALDACGMAPFPVGPTCDATNGLLYLGEGQWLWAGVSGIAILPVVGQIVTGGKWAAKGVKGADEAGVAAKRLRANKAVGDAARDRIAGRFPAAKTEVNLKAKSGWRRIDVLTSRGLAIESKVGRTGLTRTTRLQIRKDVELFNRRGNGVTSVVCEFSRSPSTGRIGPTSALREALERAGIGVRIGP